MIVFDAVVSGWVGSLLGVLGVTSIVGLFKLMGVFSELLPELIVEGVDNKIKDLNSESRFKVKNRGKLSAFNVVTEVFDLDFKIGSIKVDGSTVIKPPPIVPRVAGGESFEIPVTPGVQVEVGGKFSSFKCSVLISYEVDFFIARWSRSKKWRFELRNVSDGFFWTCQII